MFEALNSIYAKMLFKRSFEAYFKFSNNVESSIYQQLDLPKIEANIVEGVVIRINKPSCLNNSARVIIKNKNEKWAEKALSNQAINLQEELMTYLSGNRINNAVSKTVHCKNR